MLTHARALADHVTGAQTFCHKLLADLLQHLIGRTKNHVIALFLFHNGFDIVRKSQIFRKSSPGIAAADIPADQKCPLFLFKNRVRINGIDIIITAQKFLIIADWKQGCREKDTGARPIQPLLQHIGRIYAKKMQTELSFLIIITVNTIVLVKIIGQVDKIAHLKIKV